MNLGGDELELSVVIPTFNRKDCIRNSVVSVLSDIQHLRSKEVIIVDDGSTDDTLEEISDLPVKIMQNSKNLGANTSRNIGCNSAKFEWVAFHDSDDLWLQGKTAKLTEYIFKYPSSDFFFTSMIQVERDYVKRFPIVKKRIAMSEVHFKKKILMRNYVSTQTLILRKSIILGIGLFDEEMPRFQDWELAIRLIHRCKGYFIPFDSAVAYIQEDSISKKYALGLEARRKIFKKHKVLFFKNIYSSIRFYLDYLVRLIFLPLKK